MRLPPLNCLITPKILGRKKTVTIGGVHLSGYTLSCLLLLFRCVTGQRFPLGRQTVLRYDALRFRFCCISLCFHLIPLLSYFYTLQKGSIFADLKREISDKIVVHARVGEKDGNYRKETQERLEALQDEVIKTQIKYQRELEKLEKENKELRKQNLLLKQGRKPTNRQVYVKQLTRWFYVKSFICR